MKAKLRTMLLSCLALLLVLGMTSVACAYDVSFSDVPEDSWFYTDVMTLAESGVIGGYPDGTYRPTKKVTTGEALKMILLAAGYPERSRRVPPGARLSEFCHRAGLLTRYEDISDPTSI
ncbi:MAG: S-layer homology domain-containing protein [Oscillospiraceae bacterium]